MAVVWPHAWPLEHQISQTPIAVAIPMPSTTPCLTHHLAGATTGTIPAYRDPVSCMDGDMEKTGSSLAMIMAPPLHV